MAIDRKRTGMRYNRYGDDFLIDKIQPDELSEELLSVGELVADDEWQIINDNEHYPQEDYSTPERETDLEQSEIERRENANLRILEWMRDVKNGSCEGQSIQQIDMSATKHEKTEDPLFGWTATDRPLDIPSDNLEPASLRRFDWPGLRKACERWVNARLACLLVTCQKTHGR